MSAPLRPQLLEGEQELDTFPALYKKHLGTVYVSNLRVLWTATDAQAAAQRAEIAWSAVQDNMVSCTARSLLMTMLHVICQSLLHNYDTALHSSRQQARPSQL